VTEKLHCRCCGVALVAAATGRRPRWCSKGCRRAIEAKVRRLERHAQALLTEESSLRLRFAGSLGYPRLLLMAEDAAAQRVAVEAELAKLYRTIEEGDR
jgi:hypothetical protein